jgi:hypothetical protein
MRLRPSPLTEAAAVMGIAVILSALSYVILLRDLNAGLATLTSMAIFFLPPLFTFWSMIGWLVRSKTRNFRLVTNLAITTALITAVTLYIGSALSTNPSGDGLALWYYMVAVLWLSCATGGLVTYLILLRHTEPKR